MEAAADGNAKSMESLDFGVAGRVLTAATSWAAAALRGRAPRQGRDSRERGWHRESLRREHVPEVICSLTSMGQVLVITSVHFISVSSRK